MFRSLIITLVLLISSPSVRGQPGQGPTTKLFGEESVLKSVVAIYHLIPEKVLPKKMSDWTDLKLEAANAALQRAIGRSAELELTVGVVKPNPTFGQKDDPYKYEVGAVTTKIGETPVWVWCFFREDQKDALAALNKGDKVRVSGTVWHCAIHHDPGNARSVPLDINLSDCTLEPAK